VGFNAIYHLTDVPSFVSGEHLVGEVTEQAALQQQPTSVLQCGLLLSVSWLAVPAAMHAWVRIAPTAPSIALHATMLCNMSAVVCVQVIFDPHCTHLPAISSGKNSALRKAHQNAVMQVRVCVSSHAQLKSK
jgi:hypothetical protein